MTDYDTLNRVAEVGTAGMRIPKHDYRLFLPVGMPEFDATNVTFGISLGVPYDPFDNGGVVAAEPHGPGFVGHGIASSSGRLPERGITPHSATVMDRLHRGYVVQNVWMMVVPVVASPSEPRRAAGDLSRMPDDVREFSRENGLDNHLQKAINLAKQTFSPVAEWEATLGYDPDTDDKWVTLRVGVRAGQVNVSAARKKYSAEWVATVPLPHRYLVRLSPDIL